MEKILICTATAYQDTPFDQWLPEDAFELFVLASAEKQEGYAHFHNVWFFPHYVHNANVEVKALELARQHRFEALLARAEKDLRRAGRIRDLCGISGQSYASAQAFRDKVVMKDHLAGTDIPIAAYRPVDSVLDVLDFIESHGYPVVFKPRDNSGSVGVCIIREAQEMPRLLEQGLPANLMIEAYVAGPMYHVDGLIVDGTLQFICPSRYINDCLAWQEDKFIASCILDSDNPLAARLIDFTKRALAHLPCPRHTTFHAEIFHTPQDQLVFCEVASRTPGGRINQQIKAAFGLDLDRDWVRAQCGLPLDALPDPLHGHRTRTAGHVLIPPLKGWLRKLPAQKPDQDWVFEYRVNGKEGQCYNGGVKSGRSLVSIVFSGTDEDDLEQHVDHLVHWFKQETVWDLINGSEAPG